MIFRTPLCHDLWVILAKTCCLDVQNQPLKKSPLGGKLIVFTICSGVEMGKNERNTAILLMTVTIIERKQKKNRKDTDVDGKQI